MDFNNFLNNNKNNAIQYNYQFCFRGIKQAFFYLCSTYPAHFNDEKFAKMIIDIAIDFCETRIAEGFKERYSDIKLDCFVNNENIIGYSFELNDVENECECNYVAMVKSGEKLVLYTNEYFSFDDSFGLCFNYLDRRGSLSYSPKTYEEFKEDILKIETK